MRNGSQIIANDQSLTRQLAEGCAGFSYDRLPSSVQTRAKLVVLDTLGAMLAASRLSYPGTQRLSGFVNAECADGMCTVVGTDLRASPSNAALMNGYLSYALDIETLHGPSIMHAAAAVIPAALAVAQSESSSGTDLLVSLVVGIDVACRVSLAIGPTDLYNRGFHPTAVAGSFGAAVAVSLLLGQNVEQIERAFGLAATQTGGLLAWADDETEESRPFNPGLAARNGLTAGRLATLGFGAPRGIFDGGTKYNVFRAWSRDGRGSQQQLLDGFGESFAIEELTIKQYSCCGFLHPALDGLLDILRSEEIGAADVASIMMRFPRSGAPIIDNNPLRSHRAQYILPVATVRGAVSFDDVLTDRSAEPEVWRLSNVTTLIQDDDLDRTYPEQYTTEIEVRTRDDQSHSRRVERARGTPQNAMTDSEVVEKFRSLSATRIDAARIDHIVSLVEILEQADSIEELAQALTVF